ncbi:penicillin-binding transpeptidase domain-containing protein [uncultured Clostridium sp.]|uniref:penicillin-binding transpeptidase domain-containing protein n=1 Tax=uncultured Clostridium sp. TaxID=59620 RepID=UPI0025D1B27D|nr:penicillin-binding transpeptidase domain-containing protein [uncultured Clostridium sp.]MDU4883974.1 penicillin-binding transpeptidase domain-containing protein [Clostridium celatum]MDU7077173.1 penicillin-binding transpeptidase domain-containing protein [Clostridium celatum]
MKKFRNILLFSLLLIIVISISCSKINKYEETFNTFKEKWINNDFSGMYSMLSENSKKYIDEETFVNRYTNIYSAINLKDLEIEISGDIIKNEDYYTVPFSLKATTVAGELNISDYKVNIYKEDKQYLINWDESLIFPNMIEGDKVYVRTISHTRGKILDRNDNILAEDGTIYVVGIHPSKFDSENREAKITELANTLDISEETIINKLNANSNPEYFVPIVDILSNDEKLTTLVNRSDEGIIINQKTSRVYNGGEAFGRLIGYVGSITAEELESKSDKGYTQTSLIGKAGIEQVYEDTLRGEDGAEIYLSRNNEEISILKKEVVNGADIKLTIDSTLQTNSYAQLTGEKGAVTAVDPKTGEVLALVSAPSYDSNMFTTYVTKTKAAEREANNYTDQINRFSKTYAPGSTMKLLTASIGLNNGILNADESVTIDSQSWQKDSSWGNYFITRVNNITAPITLREAAKYSDNIYFAQLALKIGSENLINGIKGFGIGEELTFEYPMTNSSISNNGSLDSEILLADTGYGQGELMVTPLNMALAYSALANDGNIMNPRLVLTSDSSATVWKESAIKSEYLPTLIEDFSAMVNDANGSAHSAKIDGFNIAAKTGTAEIKASQDDTTGTENGWFVAVDTTSSKLAVAMIVEDVKDRGGSSIPIPKVKAIMEEYLNR